MWSLIRKCGSSLVPLQTADSAVPSSNPTFLAVKNPDDKQADCVLLYGKIPVDSDSNQPRRQQIDLLKCNVSRDLIISLCGAHYSDAELFSHTVSNLKRYLHVQKTLRCQ